jgi:hypothetical protein
MQIDALPARFLESVGAAPAAAAARGNCSRVSIRTKQHSVFADAQVKVHAQQLLMWVVRNEK